MSSTSSDLVIKELRSIRADPTMLILVVYAFSISVNTVATGAVTEATNLSVGIVDEDGSDLSRQIAEGLVAADLPARRCRSPRPTSIRRWTRASCCLSSKSRRTSRPISSPQRKTGIQINVDATAVAQAGNGASYLKTAIANEIQNFISGAAISDGAPINLVVRAAFNPNLKTAWFSAMTQVINQITLLTVILTGAALIREREQGTVEHLLVMPVVPAEIMLAKMIANGLVILVAAMLSLQFVVHWWIGCADRRVVCFVPARRGALCAGRGGARHHARHARDDDGPVRPARHARADRDAIAFGQQHADGEHAGVAAIRDADDQPDAAFRLVCPGGAVPRRRSHAGMAAARGDAHHRLGLFCFRHEPLPPRHFRELAAMPKTQRDRKRRQDEAQGLRKGAAQAAGRALPPAGLGESEGAAGHRRVRGPRRRREGRHDQGDHRTRQPARVPGRGAAGAVRPAKRRRCTCSATSSTFRPPAKSSSSTAVGTTAPASRT